MTITEQLQNHDDYMRGLTFYCYMETTYKTALFHCKRRIGHKYLVQRNHF